MAAQLATGSAHDQGVNNHNYDNLRIASFSPMIGIAASVMAVYLFTFISIPMRSELCRRQATCIILLPSISGLSEIGLSLIRDILYNATVP